MKKWILRAAALLIAAVMLAVPCGAQFGTDELYGAVPEEVRDVLDDSGISPTGGSESVSLTDILGYIAELVTENIGKPLKMFASVLAVVLLSALLSGISGAAAGKVYTLVTSAASAVIISLYLGDIIGTARTAFSAASDFMLVYVPVIAGVTAVGGHQASAALFSTLTLTAIQILARLTSAVIIPLTSCIIGITAAGSVDPELNLDRLSEGIKKFVVWGLGLIMTLFLGILSVQSIITASADNAAMKTLKFAVSSAVPIVGGAVSEAMSTVSGSISLLKSGIGGFGIAAGACLLAPQVIAVLCCKFALFAAGVVSDLFGSSETGKMIRSGENAMTVILAALSCFFVFITVSSAILLAFCRS